jgi:hypothetical protein
MGKSGRTDIIILVSIFLLERAFGVSLLPAAVLVMAGYNPTRSYWIWVGVLALLGDLLGGAPLGSGGMSFLPLILLALVIFKLSRFTARSTLVLGSLGTAVSVGGQVVSIWILRGSLEAPARSLIVFAGGWSFLFAYLFRFFQARRGEEDLVVKYS